MKKLLFFFLLLLLPSVYSIGLGAPNMRLILDFTPNMQRDLTYYLITIDEPTQDIQLVVEGDLAQYVELEKDVIKDVEPNSMIEFKVKLKLPEKLGSPGNHEIKIKATETLTSGSDSISVKTSSSAIIIIKAPYEGKYLIPKLHIPNIEQGEPIIVKITGTNLGTEKIDEFYGSITIKDDNQVFFEDITTNTVSVEPNKQAEVTVSHENELVSGDYIVEALVHIDDSVKELTAPLKIGTREVSIYNYSTELKANQISEFNLVIESKWNKNLESVYADIIINNIPTQTKTITLKPFEKRSLSTFVNLVENAPGEYPLKIVVYYDTKTNEIDDEILLVENKKFELNWLVVALILVILINVLFLIFRRKNAKN